VDRAIVLCVGASRMQGLSILAASPDVEALAPQSPSSTFAFRVLVAVAGRVNGWAHRSSAWRANPSIQWLL
jgi:hypothetical protein